MMAITADQARAELARRELARRGVPLKAEPKPEGSFQEISALKGKPLGTQIWKGLQVPSQMAQRGLEGMAQAMTPKQEVTGNLGRDLAMNTPAILSRTMSKVAPGFVSRGAMLTAGAVPALRGLGKAAEALGPGIAGQLESLSGMKPGLLSKAFKDPSLIFSKIPQEARDAYQASSELARKSPEVSETARPIQLVFKLMKKAKDGLISPDEALAGRKAIDQLWESKSITEDFKNTNRQLFDQIAKMQPEIKEADTAFSRGKQAAGLRQLLPQNKYGGTSAFKTAIMAGMNAMGPAGKAGMALMSPAVMGAGASALGGASKVLGPLLSSPAAAVTALQAVEALRRRRNFNPDES